MYNNILKALENEGQVPCRQYLNAKCRKKANYFRHRQALYYIIP